MTEPPSTLDEPRVGRIRAARILLYGLLAVSAVVTFTGLPTVERAVAEGRQPPLALMVAPAIFGLFIVLFALYRFFLVRLGRYHAGKAFVQVSLMALVLTLLLPGSLERYRAAEQVTPVDLARQLASPDPDARAMAAELIRHRSAGVAMSYVPRLVALLDDPIPEVRRQAKDSLVELAGSDPGGEGDGASARWRAFWIAKGVTLP